MNLKLLLIISMLISNSLFSSDPGSNTEYFICEQTDSQAGGKVGFKLMFVIHPDRNNTNSKIAISYRDWDGDDKGFIKGSTYHPVKTRSKNFSIYTDGGEYYTSEFARTGNHGVYSLWNPGSYFSLNCFLDEDY